MMHVHPVPKTHSMSHHPFSRHSLLWRRVYLTSNGILSKPVSSSSARPSIFLQSRRQTSTWTEKVNQSVLLPRWWLKKSRSGALISLESLQNTSHSLLKRIYQPCLVGWFWYIYWRTNDEYLSLNNYDASPFFHLIYPFAHRGNQLLRAVVVMEFELICELKPGNASFLRGDFVTQFCFI